MQSVFCSSVGKVTIRIGPEVPGHVANRLQAAVWREAIHLIRSGVASAGDADRAISLGPGLCRAAMGLTMLFHFAAGEGGLAAFIERYSDRMNRWLDDLGIPHPDEDIARQVIDGLKAETGTFSPDELSNQRDALVTAILKATADIPDQWTVRLRR